MKVSAKVSDNYCKIMGTFSEIGVEDFASVLKLLEARLPRSAMVNNVFQLFLSKPSTGYITVKFFIHRNFGDRKQDCLLAIISVRGLPQNLVVISGAESPSSDMLEALEACINWSKLNQFEGIERSIVSTLLTAGRKYGKIEENPPIMLYFMKISDAIKLETSPVCNEIAIKQLEIEDAEKINSRWAAQCVGSLEMLQASIESVGSAGVYTTSAITTNNFVLDRSDKADFELVSWAVALPFGSIHALHTEKDHQRKGYAQLTMKAISKFIAEKGRIPVVQIYKANDASIALNEKLGYVLSHDINLIHYFPL